VELSSAKWGTPITFYYGDESFDRFGTAVAALGAPSLYELDPILLMGAPGRDFDCIEPYLIENNNGMVTMEFWPRCVEVGAKSAETPRIDDELVARDGLSREGLDSNSGMQSLELLLGSWGPCHDPAACAGDRNYDGVIDVADLLSVLENADF
jgi:hypothetical protein